MPTQQPQPITPLSQLLTLLPQLEIFRAPSATPHARIPQGPARPWSLPIGAPEFGDWLLLTAQKELNLFPSVSQIRQALRSLAATANFGNHPTRPTPLRFLKTETALSIDLGDRANIITINAAGWSITQDIQTAWLSPRTQLPLPTPEATETSLASMLANALDLNSAKAASARRNAFEETSSGFAEASPFCACFLGEPIPPSSPTGSPTPAAPHSFRNSRLCSLVPHATRPPNSCVTSLTLQQPRFRKPLAPTFSPKPKGSTYSSSPKLLDLLTDFDDLLSQSFIPMKYPSKKQSSH